MISAGLWILRRKSASHVSFEGVAALQQRDLTMSACDITTVLQITVFSLNLAATRCLAPPSDVPSATLNWD